MIAVMTGALMPPPSNKALDKRDIFAKKMTPAQIAEAQKLAREWLAAFKKRKAK